MHRNYMIQYWIYPLQTVWKITGIEYKILCECKALDPKGQEIFAKAVGQGIRILKWLVLAGLNV